MELELESGVQRNVACAGLRRRASIVLALLVAAPAARAGTVTVNVSSEEFMPPVLTIHVGDTVVWENVQGTHNIVADDGSFSSGEPQEAPFSFSHTFTEPGSHLYHCELHGEPGGRGQSGTVFVEDGNPGEVGFLSSTYAVEEGVGIAMVTLRRSRGSEGPVSVGYRTTEEGTATAGTDYQAVEGTVAWEDGDAASKTFMVPILDDSEAEGDETVLLELVSPVGAEIEGFNPARLIIADDESASTACIPDATTLCLNRGRFRITASFETRLGVTGDAEAVQLTDDTGYLWFFNDQNVEVVAKVLNGCVPNGHYWFFAGGLTNVAVEMEVEDTATGVRNTYSNVLGVPFQPIQGTRAFDTCP